jgi:very-short-patch-repair endonuclease
MNEELRVLVARGKGVVTRADACQVVSVWALEAACRAGALHRVLPGVYADPSLVNDPALLRRAALQYADGRAALSHITALDVWGLRLCDAAEPVHLSVPTGVRLRPQPRVTVHQRCEFAIEPPHVVVRDGLPVTRLERSIVDAWPLLSPSQRPAPLIRAVNDRITTPERVAEVLAGAPRLADRAELRTLLDRLESGCRSALEIWGHDHVFTGVGMPPFQRQVRISVEGRICYLDVYAGAERVDFELDGAASHGSPRQREADLRRDALLATVGILVVRFSHRRLLTEPDAVRREVLAVLATRRR